MPLTPEQQQVLPTLAAPSATEAPLGSQALTSHLVGDGIASIYNLPAATQGGQAVNFYQLISQLNSVLNMLVPYIDSGDSAVGASFPLLLRQVGCLPIEIYYLGDGGDGGTIQADSTTGNSFVVVDYTPRILRDFPVLVGSVAGTEIYPTMNTQFTDKDSVTNTTITAINSNQVRVDFLGIQAPSTCVLSLGGYVAPVVTSNTNESTDSTDAFVVTL